MLTMERLLACVILSFQKCFKSWTRYWLWFRPEKVFICFSDFVYIRQVYWNDHWYFSPQDFKIIHLQKDERKWYHCPTANYFFQIWQRWFQTALTAVQMRVLDTASIFYHFSCISFVSFLRLLYFFRFFLLFQNYCLFIVIVSVIISVNVKSISSISCWCCNSSSSSSRLIVIVVLTVVIVIEVVRVVILLSSLL